MTSVRLTALLGVAIATGLAHAVPPRVDFWPARSDSDYLVAVEQTVAVSGSNVHIREGETAGQTFVPGVSQIARIDVKIGNMGDERPGRVSVYRWQGEYAATVARRPLWSEGIDLSGADAIRLQTFLPAIDVDPGATYFVEFGAEGRGPFRIRHTNDDRDHYRAGALRFKGRWRKNWDLWFRVFARSPKAGRRSVVTPVPRPALDTTRSQLPLHEPLSSSARLTRRSYYNRVARHANAARPSALNSCGRKGAELALPEAFLYRASCEAGRCKELHARYVRDLYIQSYAWRACGEGSSLPRRADPRERRCAATCSSDAGDWNPMRRATTAYLWTRTSAAYSDADRERIESLLVDLGRHMWKHREYGTHNRALQHAVTYRALVELFPNAPEAKEWRSYSDRVWRELFEAGDTREDSTEYASVAWWPAVLEYLAITKTEASVFADPRFRAWVERAYQLMTPIGPAAEVGHSVGFGRDSAGFIWLFEAAAKYYAEPRFREAAQRAFRFHSGWVRDRQPQSDALQQTIGALAWAYFEVDDNIAAAAPPDRVEQATRRAAVSREEGLAAHVDAPVRVSLPFDADAPLVRLTMRVRDASPTPVELTLWEWRGAPAASRSATPLYRDVAQSSADGRVDWFPFLDAPRGGTLYVEARPLSGATEFAASEPETTRAWLEAYTLDGLGSQVTYRRPVRLRPREQHGPKPFHAYKFGDGIVPEKLVLRSGFSESSMFAVLNLVHFFGHGEAEQGALVTVVDGGSLLLQSGPVPYWSHQKQRQNESRPLVRRYSRGKLLERSGPTRIEHFRDARATTVARLSYDEPRGWGARVERRVFFVKDRFLLFRDCIASDVSLDASFGTLLHPTDVGSVYGSNWYDTFVRSPTANTFRIRNRARRMLAYFVPRDGVTTEAFVEDTYAGEAGCNPFDDGDEVSAACRSGPPYVLSHSMRGELGGGKQHCFDTLLVPHAPAEPASALAAGVKVLRADDTTLALEIQLGSERWLVVDDSSAIGVSLPGLEANLRYAVARVEPGEPPYFLVSEARRFEWRGVAASWEVPVSSEVGARVGRRSEVAAD